MKLKPVNIIFEDGWRRVWGLVDGSLAITPSYHADKRERGRYVVTHVPTGSVIDTKFSMTKREALSLFNEWKNRQWRGRTIIDIPACELIELAPLINKECFGTDISPREQLAELNRCKEVAQ